jgi:hypothetical protein
MPPSVKVSLKPLHAALWKTHDPSGARFEIMPLQGQLDQEITDRCTNFAGAVNMHAFGQELAPHIIRNWEGMGDASGCLPCNPENLKLFVESHCLSIMPWVIRTARSLEFYRQEEIEQAKNA